MYTISSTPDSVCKELAKRHKALRKQLKLTQAELADRAGVSLGSLKRFETTGQISLESLLKLANLLNRLSDFDTIFTPREDKKELERLFSTKH
ncbi:helix-turn-helix transcriptional regulator [Carboxylicivirga mesophila]|uniref:Helix-turn-helix transcriptional regulator n=1 Tax=Carboxylicivirga mesophila TaxID=1166478 RepID=A0ABS5K8L5_9BACT|nr:helix-turn-helix transcriptional regulator [Carboxylicivirga mesophila]MBS2210723.1 helix-turn-helix transcriptional regulator [Carboxylicivirga mesophila]